MFLADKTKANGSANIVNGRLKAASGGSDEDKSSKSTHTSRTPRDNDQSRARSLERPLGMSLPTVWNNGEGKSIISKLSQTFASSFLYHSQRVPKWQE